MFHMERRSRNTIIIIIMKAAGVEIEIACS